MGALTHTQTSASSPSPPSSPLLTPKVGREKINIPESLPPSDITPPSIPSVSSFDSEQQTIDTQALKEFLMEATEGSEGEDDQEMLGQYYARTRHVITY